MNEKFVMDMFDAIDASDFDRLIDFFSPDIVYERPGYEPLQGFSAVDEFYRRKRIILSGRHRLTRIVVADQAGASWGRFTGVSRNGEPLDERFSDVYEFSGGLLSRRTTYFFRAAI